MKLKYLKTENFRNFENIEISFNETCNFIVGDNNLGKSNILDLLNIVFTKRSFTIDDFSDISKPINVEFQLKLADVEIGLFEDLFDLHDYSIINIVCTQPTPDDNIEFYHKETKTCISYTNIRGLNYIFYDSLRNPISEINFDKNRGVGKFLTKIVKDFLANKSITKENIINYREIQKLLKDINSKLVKVKTIKDYKLIADVDDNILDLIPKLIILKDKQGIGLTKSGYGVQFLLLVTLAIIDKLQFIIDQRGDRIIFDNEENGEKSISLILGLDEPEIHLHPYMQRSLIKYLNEILNNDNPDFRSLIKELFGIDCFIGQIIVVTHSPNIILNDYRQIIRLHKDGNATKIVSGCNINLDEQLEKHLLLQFPFIKEAFFSRCAILVEGDSEFGCLPYFGLKIGVDFDNFGISVIKATGKEAIKPLLELLERFGIPAVGIIDKDSDDSPTQYDNLFKTSKKDFEDELMFLIDERKEEILRNIVKKYDSQGENRELKKEAINKRAYEKYGYLSQPFTENLKLSTIDRNNLAYLKLYYVTWFSINKSQSLGGLIGMHLDEGDIPHVYKDVIKKAKNYVES